MNKEERVLAKLKANGFEVWELKDSMIPRMIFKQISFRDHHARYEYRTKPSEANENFLDAIIELVNEYLFHTMCAHLREIYPDGLELERQFKEEYESKLLASIYKVTTKGSGQND